MNPFIFENPPVLESEDGQILAEYLSRQLLALSASLDTLYNFQNAEPFLGKPQDGMLRWFEGGAPGNDKGAGFYYHFDGEWRYIGASEVITYGASIPGTGNVWDDVNAHDFTGHPYATGTCLRIESNAIVTFGHDAVAYLWEGPNDVCIGFGGDYVSVEADFVPIGTADHAILVNRDAANAHPQSSITDLLTDQAAQDQSLLDHQNAVPAHTMLQIDGLNADQQRQDDALTEAYDLLVLAGYGGLYLSAPVAGPTIGGAWQTLTQMDAGAISVPRYVIQDVANNGLIFDLEGIWAVSINLAFAHNEVNSGRTTQIRLRNDDTGATGPPRLLATGRNQEATIYSTTVLVEITETEMHDLWQIQIGNGDTYSSVTWTDQSFEAWHVSEFKPPFGV